MATGAVGRDSLRSSCVTNNERQRWALGIIVVAILVGLAFVFLGQGGSQPVVTDQTNDEMEVAPS